MATWSIRRLLKKILPPAMLDRARSAKIRARLAITPPLDRIGFVYHTDAGPVDFRGLEITPEDAMRRAAGLPCLIDVPLNHLRNMGPAWGFPYFPCRRNSGNPYVDTVIQLIHGEISGYPGSFLEAYYESFQPHMIADVLGIDDNGELHFLLQQPPLLTFPPWVRPPLDDFRAHLKWREEMIGVESREHGRKLGYRDGWAGFGPVSTHKGAFEVERLISVARRIADDGYKIMTGKKAVCVNIMRSGNEYRFLCIHGQHRTSALAALGHGSVPAWPKGAVIDRKDVHKWPGVVQSVFSPEQALAIFDMFFHGRPPEAAVRWWRELKTQDQDVKVPAQP